MQALMVQNCEIQIKKAAAILALMEKYVEYLDVRRQSIRTYATGLRQFLLWMEENGIREPQRPDVIQFREDMGKTRKPATVQTYMIAVRQFFRWTYTEGLYPNVAENVKGVRVSKNHKKDALTKQQAREVIGHLKESETVTGRRDYAIFLTAATGGLRTIEITRANKDDLRTKSTGEGDLHVLYLQGKGHDDRDEFVIIPDPVYEAIRDYLKARGRTKADAPLFASESNRNKGGRMTTRSVSRIIKNALIECGLDSDRLTAHSLRHTAGTIALREGQPIQDVQQFLRHSNIDTTMIYIQEQEQIENKSSRSVADALFREEGES